MTLYDPHIFMCTNRRPDDHPRGSCGARDGEALRQYLREKLKSANVENARANMAGCMDQCENGPVLVIYPEGIWYRASSKTDIDRIVEQHLVSGKIVTELHIVQRVK